MFTDHMTLVLTARKLGVGERSGRCRDIAHGASEGEEEGYRTEKRDGVNQTRFCVC